jgi:hypothetical protein
MISNFQSYAMFTPAGDKAVAGIVARAKIEGWTWSRTQAELYVLANSDAQLYGEATDTAVRECVYDALGFETNFYV